MQKKIILLILFITVFHNSYAQDLTIAQTINYINNKLANSKFIDKINQLDFSVMYHKRFKNITLTNEGKVSITETIGWGKTSGSDEKKDNDESTEFYANDADVLLLGGSITIICKATASKSNCIYNASYAAKFISTYDWEFDDNNVAQSICNALKHLLTLLQNDAKYTNHANDNDPFASKSYVANKPSNNNEVFATTSSSAKNIVPMMKSASGIYEVPVLLNGVLKISFIFDSGASDISISPDVALTLMRTGTIKQTDFVGSQTYQFADGSTATSKVFNLHQIKIGNKVLTNVRASISESIEAPMLLGQSVLQRFGKFTIDNNNHTLTID